MRQQFKKRKEILFEERIYRDGQQGEEDYRLR